MTNEWNHCYNNVLNRLLPLGWREVERAEDGTAYTNGHLRVIISAHRELDSYLWLHFSVSTAVDVPTYMDLEKVRNIFLGDKECYQVIPRVARKVNIHPYVLHFFYCVDVPERLPDFTRGTGTL